MYFKQRFVKKMKKISSSFCMCFDSVVLENGLMVGEGSKSSSEVKPVLSPAANMMSSDDKDKDFVGSFVRKHKLGRRSFSRYVKAVLFETSLMKKIRSKKLGQKLHRIYSSDKSKSKPKKIFNSMNNNAPCEDNHSTRSTSKFSSCLCTNLATNSSSLSSSSSTTASSCSSSSSLSWNSRPLLSKSVEKYSMQGKLGKDNNGKGCHGFNVGICCLLLISLLVLVIWGKVCAIFCTSTWLLFANRWIKSTKQDPLENVVVDHHFPEIFDTEFYKKKVIMEGLLERNHSRN